MPLKRDADSNPPKSPSKKTKIAKTSSSTETSKLLSSQKKTALETPTQPLVVESPTRTSGRSRKQTEKALLALAEFQAKSTAHASAGQSGPTESPQPKSSPDQKTAVYSPNTEAKAGKLVKKPRRKLGSPIVINSDDSDDPTLGGFIVPDGNDSESVLSVSEDGELSGEIVASAEPDSIKENDSVGVANDTEDNVAALGDSEVEIDGDSTVEGENVSDGGKQSTETETSVMRAGYQDSLEEEMGLYESLPFLPTAATVLPFRSYTYKFGIDVKAFCLPKVKFSSVYRHYSHEVRLSIVNSLLFVRSGPYVNLSRVDPVQLCCVESRITCLDTKKTAACVMTGFATVSNITETVERSGRNQETSRFRQLTVSPFSQFFHREVAVWGQVLGFNAISGSAVEQGMSFTTRPEQVSATPSSSPVKSPSRVIARPTHSRVLRLNAHVSAPVQATSSSIPSSLSFTDDIPLYDGRPGFRHNDRGFDFSDSDFASLTSWPRFAQNEVPLDAAVAVGYTANTYKSNSGQGNEYINLSTNILFVIVLGLFVENEG